MLIERCVFCGCRYVHDGSRSCLCEKTNYEVNNVDSGDVENEYNKMRHVFIEQTVQTSPYVKHYILLFEDLPFSLYTNDGTYNSILGFNNVQLIITVIQNNQQTITATLV